MIILEGPDGAGKTYTASWLSKRLCIPVYHSKDPTSSIPKNRILDRCPLISELIYGPILRGKSLTNKKDLLDFIDLYRPMIVYCRPSIQTLLQTPIIGKPHKSSFFISQLKLHQEEIIKAYDNLMKTLPHITFNRDESCVELT